MPIPIFKEFLDQEDISYTLIGRLSLNLRFHQILFLTEKIRLISNKKMRIEYGEAFSSNFPCRR